MTLHRRSALNSLICAILFTALAAYFVTTPYWVGTLLASYAAILAAWYARVQYGRHCREMAESEWLRRASLGIKQNPLYPCCLPFDETGSWHDEARCTRERDPGLRMDQARMEDEWDKLVAGLSDLAQEEEA